MINELLGESRKMFSTLSSRISAVELGEGQQNKTPRRRSRRGRRKWTASLPEPFYPEVSAPHWVSEVTDYHTAPATLNTAKPCSLEQAACQALSSSQVSDYEQPGKDQAAVKEKGFGLRHISEQHSVPASQFADVPVELPVQGASLHINDMGLKHGATAWRQQPRPAQDWPAKCLSREASAASGTSCGEPVTSP